MSIQLEDEGSGLVQSKKDLAVSNSVGMKVGLGVALVFASVFGAGGAAMAVPNGALAAGKLAPPVNEEKRETGEGYDCVTWLVKDGSRYKVALRCDRMENARIRGVLDISWASDKHTSWISPDSVGTTVYSDSYGNLDKIRGTRIEQHIPNIGYP